jgi:hypothetical protein
MLGLRAISSDSIKDEEERLREERERKRRRVGSLSIPSSKGKEKEIEVECEGSDEYSDNDDDDDGDDGDNDDDDAYYPSRSSSPAMDDTSPCPGKAISRFESLSSSGTGNSQRRSTSTQTVSTTTTSMSSNHQNGEGKDSKRGKGKVKGSAALALAKVAMLSGRSLASPWGTYVPFPLDNDHDMPKLSPGDATQVRAGRRRRNGHIPLPVPIPHLIKKSRGRKVPYMAKEVTSPGSSSSSRKRDGEELKRTFVCEVSGCGKCFVRGEHLKRHVRSIHTHDKRMYFRL